jgi:parvulin-like peptidyl-prolyl isomerase
VGATRANRFDYAARFVGAQSGKPGRGKRPAAKAAAGRSVGRKRLALIVFGVLFVGLFVVFAVAQGIGQPSVPSGDAVLIQDAPEGQGNISEEDFERNLELAAKQAGAKKTPKPGSKKYEEVKEVALVELIEGVWLRGQAEDLGIPVTEKQIEQELEQIKKTNFPTPAAYKEFLATSGYTQEDVNDRVELQVITKGIQTAVTNEVPPPTKSEISDYYNAGKASKYTTKPSRDVRLVVNKSEAKVKEALAELEKDNSPANWKKVAPKFSSDPTTSSQGGLQKEISEEVLQEPLKKEIFGAASGELLGPIKYQGNYFIFEVAKLNPEKVKKLAEVEQEITSQLQQEAQQQGLEKFVASYQAKWRARTFCAAGFLVNQCSNAKPPAHPASAPAACYEANPKTPATECPAPVEQTKPALPGTTTLLAPQGERLVQRPRPEGKTEGVKEAELGGEGEGGGAAGE